METVLTSHKYEVCKVFVALDKEAHISSEADTECPFTLYQDLLTDVMTSDDVPLPEVKEQ